MPAKYGISVREKILLFPGRHIRYRDLSAYSAGRSGNAAYGGCYFYIPVYAGGRKEMGIKNENHEDLAKRSNDAKELKKSGVFFEPQPEDDMRKKTLIYNVHKMIMSAVHYKLFWLAEKEGQDMGLADKDIPRLKLDFEKTDMGIDVIFSIGDKAAGRSRTVHLNDYRLLDDKDIAKIISDLVKCLNIKIYGTAFFDEAILPLLKESASRQEMSEQKKEMSGIKIYNAKDIAKYVIYHTKVADGVLLSRYSAESINIIMFYIRAAGLVMKAGPVFSGEITVDTVRNIPVSAASDFIKTHSSGNKVCYDAADKYVDLDSSTAALIDSVLAILPPKDEKVKESLDFHPSFYKAVLSGEGSTISEDLIKTDFSSPQLLEKRKDDYVRSLTGSQYNQLAICMKIADDRKYLPAASL